MTARLTQNGVGAAELASAHLPLPITRPDEPSQRSALFPERTVRLFGLDIADTTLDGAAHWIVERARHGVRTRVAFLNAHCVNVMSRDPQYKTALQQSDRIYADGSGVMMAARTAGLRLRDNVNGTDLFPVLCREATAANVGIYLFGGRKGVAAEAGYRMVLADPQLKICGSHHGYIGSSEQEAQVVSSINASGAGIVLVGLGVPLQEMWIARNRQLLEAPVVIGVGGLFDYYSGRIPRAPLFMRKAGCEWVWRVAQEPVRLGRRYFVGNIEFLIRLGWQRCVTPEHFGERPVGAPQF